MSWWMILLTGVALSMDAFAVSVCKGLRMKKISYRKAAIVGLYFGVFQALMPLIGYFVAGSFQSYITSFDHWIAFVLLVLIGANMIREAVGKNDDEENIDSDVGIKAMLPLAIATSIDALAVGISFACSGISIPIFAAVSMIGATTFAISVAGVAVGCFFGDRFKSKAEITGGVILILIGVKILVEHLTA